MDLTNLYRALHQKARFEVAAEPSASETQVRIVGRLPRNIGIQQWLLVMDRLLERAERSTWKVDISKHYFRRGGQIVYGWRLIIQGEGLSTKIGEIVTAVNSAPQAARQEVMGMPLVGASADRNNPSATGRGAGGVFTTPVGPMAVQRRNMGG